MLGYLVSGIFLSVLYYPHFWLLISLCVALRNMDIQMTELEKACGI